MWTRTIPVVVLVAAVLVGCAPPSDPAPQTPPLAVRPPQPLPVSQVPPPTPAVVVLDPGHNGGNSAAPAEINRQVPDGRGGRKACNTTGTATDAGYPEHEFTFDVARRVEALLTAQGVQVVLTRTDDAGIGPCVDVRGRAGQDHDADAVVSIHADGASAAGRGFHVAYASPPLDPVQDGPARALAEDLRTALVGAGFPTSTYVGRNGLSPRSDLAGLNHARRPAALVECANMRNPGEAEVVASPEGRARYAAAIAAGVVEFLRRR